MQRESVQILHEGVLSERLLLLSNVVSDFLLLGFLQNLYISINKTIIIFLNAVLYNHHFLFLLLLRVQSNLEKQIN